MPTICVTTTFHSRSKQAHQSAPVILVYNFKIYKIIWFIGYTRGGSRGGHGGQKAPSSRIILGKPKECCSGIKMP